MNEYLAIFISVATFAFTLYQWLFAMNSKRPRLQAHNFKPLKIHQNQDYGYFDIQLPLDLFVINLSELPNSILEMKLYAKIGKEWIEGKFIDYSRWDPSKPSFNPFPVLIQGHTYFKLGGKEGKYPYIYEFKGNPTAKDWDNLSLWLDVYDQYGKVHRHAISRRKHFPKLTVEPYVYTQNELAKWNMQDPDYPEDKSVYRVTYSPEYTINSIVNPTISLQRYYRYAGSGSDMISINRYYMKQQCADWKSKQEKFLYSDSLSYAPSGMKGKVYFYPENGLLKFLEIEITVGNDVVTQKVALPEGFIQSLAKEEE